jgi:hypothetical protein
MGKTATLFPATSDPSPRRNTISLPESIQPAAAPRIRVGQDKRAGKRARPASPQPAVVEKPVRADEHKTHSNTRRTRSSFAPATPARRKHQITLWVSQPVAAELARVAKQDGLSVSAAGAALLEQALMKDLQTQHAALLAPVIEQTIKRELNRLHRRLGILLIRNLFSAGQTRRLVVNILGRQQGVNEKILNQIIDAATNASKKDASRKSVQLDAIEKEELARWSSGDESV